MAFSFGSTATAPSSGFNFGSTPAASSGFSFGGTTGAPSAPSSFSFGGTSTAPAVSSGVNFGANPSSTPATNFSISASAAPTSNAPSLFGASTTTPTPTGFGFGNFGTTLQQPVPTTGFGFGTSAAQPAALAGPPITLETKFEALPEDLKKNMTQFHAFLKEQDQSDAFLKTVSPRQIEVLRENMAQLEQEVLVRRNRQDRQTAAVQHLRQNVRQLLHQVDAATLTRRSLDNSTGGTSNMYHVMRHVEMPSPYYWDLLDHYEHKMATIKAQIEDVEAQFKPLYDGQSSATNVNKTPAPIQLQQILLAQNAALMQAAARVAEVHEKAEELRQLFLGKIRDDMARHGEKNSAAIQNPFDKRKKSSEIDKRQAIDTFRFRTSVAPTIVNPQTAPNSTTGFGFGTTATPSAPTSAFGIGASAPAKTVSFNFSPIATSAPASTTTTPFAAGGFTAPTVATSAFGNTTPSSFAPVTDTVNTGKRGGRAHKMRK